MNQTFTPASSYLSENLIRAAVKNGSYGQPSKKTVDFIRNFAAGMSFVA
ncbi:MAG: hypothetical protein J5705_01510 [Bacteroidaceae bacterium]|nr:hypothetical protein [Bacteroidaceae bacterium]